MCFAGFYNRNTPETSTQNPKVNLLVSALTRLNGQIWKLLSTTTASVSGFADVLMHELSAGLAETRVRPVRIKSDDRR